MSASKHGAQDVGTIFSELDFLIASASRGHTCPFDIAAAWLK